MQSKRLKVLMLGWEFPPFLTGGLGQACYGIAKALSHHVDLTLIVPQSNPQFILENVSIVGLNQLTDEDVTIEKQAYHLEEITEVVFVPMDVSPYPIPVMKTIKKIEQVTSTIKEKTMDARQIRELYSDGQNYGVNILEKVDTFSEVVAQIALKREFDIIHAHDWLTFPAGIRLKRLTGKPLVVHVHSLETDRIGMSARSPQNKVYHIEYDGMSMADLIIPVSYFTKAQILEHYPFIEADKIFPVHNAIDPLPEQHTATHILQQEPEKLSDYGYSKKPTAPNKKMILFLGRITYQKGPEFLLETAEKLLQKDSNVVFVIVGAGDQQQWLINQVSKRKLGEYFIFTGFLSKKRVHELLDNVDVYFMPSVSEPFGLSALEAAQHEVPAVLSKQSGVAEVLHNVLKADCWDANKFANYLYALLHYEGIRELLAEASKKEVEKLTWESVAVQIVELYKKQLFSSLEMI